LIKSPTTNQTTLPDIEPMPRYSFTTIIHERRIRLSRHSWRKVSAAASKAESFII
jgi:hypothetical protein